MINHLKKSPFDKHQRFAASQDSDWKPYNRFMLERVRAANELTKGEVRMQIVWWKTLQDDVGDAAKGEEATNGRFHCTLIV